MALFFVQATTRLHYFIKFVDVDLAYLWADFLDEKSGHKF